MAVINAENEMQNDMDSSGEPRLWNRQRASSRAKRRGLHPGNRGARFAPVHVVRQQRQVWRWISMSLVSHGYSVSEVNANTVLLFFSDDFSLFIFDHGSIFVTGMQTPLLSVFSGLIFWIMIFVFSETQNVQQ